LRVDRYTAGAASRNSIHVGAEYDLPQHVERLRSRGLSGKRSLAIREFCLGIEGLTRFVNREPLRRVHECVFGVLALESEPVDPRL
jgi:protein phosphatase